MSSTSEIATDYGNAIRDLKSNNKTQINMLTILAEDYKEMSPTIVDVLETEILESPPSRKILLLYVLDSIIKNIPESGQYRPHFAKNIAKIFTHVFEESGEKTRALLYKLRQTWVDIFPAGKLHDIDMRVHAIDNAWPFTPITSAPTTSTAAAVNHSTVHVNPKFFKKSSGIKRKAPSTTTVTIGHDNEDIKPSKEELAKVRKEEPKVIAQPSLNDEKPKIVGDSWRPNPNHSTSTKFGNNQSTCGSSPLMAVNNQQTSSCIQPVSSCPQSILVSHEPVPNDHQPMPSNDQRSIKTSCHNQSTISNETPRLPRLPTNNRVFVDGKAYEVIFLCDVPVIIRNGLPHRVSFSGSPRDIMIDGVLHKLAFGEVKTVIIDNEPHLIRFGAPSREFYMRDKAFRGVFGGPPIIVSIDGRRHEIRLLGPPPEAKIEQDPSYELTRYMTSTVPVSQQQQLFNHMTTMLPPLMPNSGAGMMMPPNLRPPPPIPNSSTQSQNNFNEVNTLLKKLRYSGILGAITNQKKSNDTVVSQQPSQTQPSTDIRNSNSPPIPSTQRLDNIERRAAPMSALDHFSMRSLAVRYDSVVSALLKDRVECPSCGIAINELYGEAYHQHTAWHMRVLKSDAYTRSRPWFMCNEWFTYSETDLANRVIVADTEKVTEDKKVDVAGSTTGDALSSDVETNKCCVCNEKFEEYFDEDDDAWKLRDCVLIDRKAHHRYCKTDAE